MAKATKTATKSTSGKRTTIAPKGDKRYIRRNDQGQITESDDVGKSLSKDVQKHAKTEVKPGYGDRGDQPTKAATSKKVSSPKKTTTTKKAAVAKKASAPSKAATPKKAASKKSAK